MTLGAAVRQLRGPESQQRFATRLNMALRTIQLYEHDAARTPDARCYVALMADAYRERRADLYCVFRQMLIRALAPPPGWIFTLDVRPEARAGEEQS